MPANEKSNPRPKKQTLGSALGLKEPGGIMALLGEKGVAGEPMEGARELPLELIDPNPHQSRQAFSVESLDELASSIREHGVIEPIIVRQAGDRFQIVAGERRYRASGLAEKTTIPARIMPLDDTQAALITALENLQREDLDIEDEARQYARVLEMTGMSQRALARMLGKDHLYVSRRVKLLQRPDLMEEYRAGRMKLLQAVALVDESAEAIGSQRTTGGEGDDSGSLRTGEEDYELVERDGMPGFLVMRGTGHDDSPTVTVKRGGFRWRPLQQFYTWVGRTKVEDIPADERASVRAQLTEIKEALEKQISDLEVLSGD